MTRSTYINVLTLLRGVVGLYGIVPYSASQRRREIGIRMALDAQQRAVYSLVLKEAGWLTAFGILIGLVCSTAFSSRAPCRRCYPPITPAECPAKMVR